MPLFADSSEVYDLIGETIRELAADERLQHRFADLDGVLELRYRHPDALITIDLRRGRPTTVDFGPTGLEADVKLDSEADVAHRWWLGELNLTIALARGQMRASGPVRKLLRLLPLIGPGRTGYRARLQRAGRADLLAA